jgi:hypothetical protein
VTLRVEDLRGEARDAFQMWRDTFGLSEVTAMNALVEDGVIKLSEHDQLARSLQETFGLSDAAADVAVRGRGDLLSSRPATPSVLSESWRPDPGDAFRVIRKIKEAAADLVSRGVEERTALKESSFAMLRLMPTDWMADWVANIIHHHWPDLYGERSAGQRCRGWLSPKCGVDQVVGVTSPALAHGRPGVGVKVDEGVFLLASR